jgi:hypothetical protein
MVLCAADMTWAKNCGFSRKEQAASMYYCLKRHWDVEITRAFDKDDWTIAEMTIDGMLNQSQAIMNGNQSKL